MKLERFCRATLPAVMIIALAGCKQSPEVRSAKHLEAGKTLLQKNDSARAVIEFQNAVQATPKSAEAFFQLGNAFLRTGDFRKGVASLRRAIELDPKHKAAQLQLAGLMSTADDPTILKEAQDLLQTLLAQAPDNPETLHTLAVTELKLGAPEDALQHLELAFTKAPKELLLAVSLAQVKIFQKDLKGAEGVLRKACEESPKSPEARVLLGRFFFGQRRLPEAEQQFKSALELDPKNLAATFNYAMLQRYQGHKQEAEQSLKRLSTFSDHGVQPFYGMFLFEENRRDEAIREFDRLFKQDPTDRVSRARLVAAYHASKREAEAQQILEAVLKANPKDLEALLQRAELHVSAKRYADAEADLNRVLHLKGDAPEAHLALANVHQARGAKSSQRKELNEALRLNSYFLQARIELAQSLIADNSAQAALGVLDATPDSQKPLLAIAEQRNWALLSLGRWAEARASLQQAIAQSRTPDLLLQDAYLLSMDKRYGDARQRLNEILSGHPEEVRALRALVGTYVAQKQVPAAVAEVKAHVAKNSKSAPLQYFLGTLLAETGNRNEAKRAFEITKALDPDFAAADLSLIQLNLTESKWGDARKQLANVLQTDGDNSTARQWLGMLEASAGNQPAAIVAFRKVVSTQPDNALALNNLAYLLAESGDQTDEPLKYAQRAVELQPDNHEFEDTLGWVLYRKGVYQTAVKHLERAVKQPTAVRQYHLAMAYYKAGQEHEGRTTLNTALKLDPNLPEAKAARQLFGN